MAAGQIVGALIPGPLLARHLGRRAAISFGAVFTFLGCVVASYLTTAAGTSMTVHYIGRFLTGVGVGAAACVLPMYCAEVVTPSIRGRANTSYQLLNVVGGFVTVAMLATVGGPTARLIKGWETGFMLPGYMGLVLAFLVGNIVALLNGHCRHTSIELLLKRDDTSLRGSLQWGYYHQFWLDLRSPRLECCGLLLAQIIELWIQVLEVRIIVICVWLTVSVPIRPLAPLTLRRVVNAIAMTDQVNYFCSKDQRSIVVNQLCFYGESHC